LEDILLGVVGGRTQAVHKNVRKENTILIDAKSMYPSVAYKEFVEDKLGIYKAV
jgi:hypothetical protein